MFLFNASMMNQVWELRGTIRTVYKVAQGFPIPLKMGLYYKSNQRSKHATYTNCKQHDRGRNL